MKEFKKIALVLIGFCACFLLLDFGVGKFFDWAIKQMPSEGERVAKSYYSLNKVKDDIIIVGSSRAETGYNSMILMDSLQNLSVFNSGGDSQGFFYVNILVNSILDRYTPKVIIWDFKERELGGMSNENLSLVYPYYKQSTYIKEILNDMQGRSFKYKMRVNAYRYNATAGRILRSIFSSNTNFYGTRGYGPRKVTEASMTIFPRDFKIENGTLNKKKVDAFLATVKRINECGSKLIVVISPMYNDYNQENFYTSETLRICKENGALFIDDSHLDGFIHNNDYTFDNYHLNENGANEFTKRLVGQIKDFIYE